MQVLLTGLSHRSTPLEVRERVSFTGEQLPDALVHLRDEVGEGIILSTCNRTEIYSTPEDPAQARSSTEGYLASYHGLGASEITPHLYSYSGAEAAQHLFRVASGLDSMILGESQILGQVRSALVAASDTYQVQVPLSRLFHGAIRTGRRVREETDIGRNALSISYAGVQLAQRVLGGLTGVRVLLIGAGEAGELVAKALRTVGVSDLMIANRTWERGEEVARRLGGRTIPFSQVGQAVGDADIIVAATEAEKFVVTSQMVTEAVGDRRPRHLFFFDLSVPRNVDPEIASMENVSLFNIDDLSSIAEENLQERRGAVAEAEQIVDEELSRFMTWWDSLEAVELVKTLRRQAEETRLRELSRALGKLPGLQAKDRRVVEDLSRALVRKLLHDPTMRLKQRAGKAHIQAVRHLFRLEEDQS